MRVILLFAVLIITSCSSVDNNRSSLLYTHTAPAERRAEYYKLLLSNSVEIDSVVRLKSMVVNVYGDKKFKFVDSLSSGGGQPTYCIFVSHLIDGLYVAVVIFEGEVEGMFEVRP